MKDAFILLPSSFCLPIVLLLSSHAPAQQRKAPFVAVFNIEIK